MPHCACHSIHPFRCQFPGETVFFRVNEEDWCRFHLPLKSTAGNPSPKATGKAGWEIGGSERQAFDTEIHARIRMATPRPQGPSSIITRPDTRADLRGVAFPPRIVFSMIADKLNVNFERASFGDISSFSCANFEDDANFTDVKLGANTSFAGATFEGEASFAGASFGPFANFYAATFNRHASFRNAKFSTLSNFDGAGFLEIADFSADKPTYPELDIGNLSFSETRFTGRCSFANRTFVGNASFNDAVFKDLVEFHGGTFHPGMSFHGTRFTRTRGNDDAATEKLERSYRTLKRVMADLHARNEEADFFALEMECRRQRRDIGRIVPFVAIWYKRLSDYGRSVVRPLTWLGGLTALAFLFYAALFFWISGVIPGGPFRHLPAIFEFTLEQMFSPFKIWFSPAGGKTIHEAVRVLLLEYYPPLVKILASLQSLATIGLLTLFLLALRRRFKMD